MAKRNTINVRPLIVTVIADTWGRHLNGGRPVSPGEERTLRYIGLGARQILRKLDRAGYSIRPKRKSRRGSGGGGAA